MKFPLANMFKNYMVCHILFKRIVARYFLNVESYFSEMMFFKVTEIELPVSSVQCIVQLTRGWKKVVTINLPRGNVLSFQQLLIRLIS